MSLRNASLLRPPVARAAYSDRTAWLMAEMSRLAYERFEPPDEVLDALIGQIATLEDTGRVKRAIERFVQETTAHGGEGRQQLEAALSVANFELVATFNNGGTQAYLAKRDADRMAVLSFRGTEKDFRDIKTDLRARFYQRGGTKTHSGFLDAFRFVEPSISRAIDDLGDYKLYLTGHSLGGALALIAARCLSSDSVAACYTFGSPKVGNDEFGDAIKVPIYRVVNAADSVPRLPPTWLWEILIGLCSVLPIPYVRRGVLSLARQFRGYRHHGDMRYLTACRESYSDLRLIANPNLVDRVWWMCARLASDIKAGFRDHAIDRYCEKLEVYAVKRLDEREADGAPASRAMAGEPARAGEGAAGHHAGKPQRAGGATSPLR